MAKVQVEVLFDGFSNMNSSAQTMQANCSCTLVRSDSVTMIIDTMTAWDGERIIEALSSFGIEPNDASGISNACSSTHGHSDHIGNLNLFLQAKHIVATSMNEHEKYYDVLQNGTSLQIGDGIEIVPTPGHTSSCVSVIIPNTEKGTIAVTGDLFEKQEDTDSPLMWMEVAGSEDPLKQAQNRLKVLRIADYVVPGHGPMFKVTEKIRKKNEAHMIELKKQYASQTSDNGT